jgi:hypothetical protein
MKLKLTEHIKYENKKEILKINALNTLYKGSEC